MVQCRPFVISQEAKMPTQNLLKIAERFPGFQKAMIELGFRRIWKGEFQKDSQRLGLVAPRPRKGREVGFKIHANGLTAHVWTTILEDEQVPREKGEDAGWVLITERDKARYFAHPLNRIGDFLGRLYKRAQVARLRVLERPLCPTCDAAMRIAFGDAPKSRYWECFKLTQHPDGKPVWSRWDIGLEKYPKALAFAQQERKNRKPHQDKMRAEGKAPVGTAMKKRRPWKATRPENVV